MLSFIAFVAIVNLLLGYAIGSYLTASRGRVVTIVGDVSKLVSQKAPEKKEVTPTDIPPAVNPHLTLERAPRPAETHPADAGHDDEPGDFPLSSSESFAEQLEGTVATV